MRNVIAVIAGYAAWTVIWLGGNAVFFGRVAETVSAGDIYAVGGVLLAVIVLSVFCSLAAGLVAASIARYRARGVVLVMAALLLATGIGVQAGVWSLMPVWYHLIFLALIVPVCVAGGRIAGSAVGASAVRAA